MSDRYDIQIDIPAKLDDVINDSLREVERIHRRRVIKRVTTTVGSFLVVVAAFFVFGFTNPALASQIPLIGRLFQTINNADSKTYGTVVIDSPGVAQAIHKETEGSNSDCKLTVETVYCDGHDINLSFLLEAPEVLTRQYRKISAVRGHGCSATVNGVDILPPYNLSMNGFEEENGQLAATMHLRLPEELEGLESYELFLKLGGFEAWNSNEEGGSLKLSDEFTAALTVQSDLASEITFTADSESNGAKLLKVSATPSRTVLTMEQPYWGEAPIDSDVYDYSMGFPQLFTENGQELQMNYNDTRDKGRWDNESKEIQTYDVYFDGAPQGATELILQYREWRDTGEILAEFSIDLESQTITSVPIE